MCSKMYAFWDDRVLYMSRGRPESENDKRMWWVGGNKVAAFSCQCTSTSHAATVRKPSSNYGGTLQARTRPIVQYIMIPMQVSMAIVETVQR